MKAIIKTIKFYIVIKLLKFKSTKPYRRDWIKMWIKETHYDGKIAIIKNFMNEWSFYKIFNSSTGQKADRLLF